jgi:PAS domain S-box-containing protein
MTETPPDHLRFLADHLSGDVLFGVDADGVVRGWGAAAERFFGRGVVDVEGRPAAELMLDGAEALGAALRDLLPGESREVSVTWRAAQGTPRRLRGWIFRPGERPDGLRICLLPGAGRTSSRELLHLLGTAAVASNEARSADEAIQIVLDEVCAVTGWPVGHAYLHQADGDLVPTSLWHLEDPERFALLREVTQASSFRTGEGLIGQVTHHCAPVWIEDVTRDRGWVRGQHGDLGVRAAFALPVMVAQEVAAVLEFYSEEPAPPRPELLDVLRNVGAQLGRTIERERAAERLRLSEARYGGMINISSDAVVSINEAQEITFFNPGAEKIFGFAAEEVLGREIDILIPHAFRPGHAAQVRAFGDGPVSARRMGERGQISGLRRNGEIFPADASISKMEVGGERIYTAVVRDVTERTRAEESLARQAAELTRSNAELEQFAYVASHDLKEPLRMVASYTQLLARRYGDQLDDDAREFIGYAVEGVTRMQSLINDLLAYSRVGTRGGEFEEVELDAVVHQTLVTLGPAIEEAGADVRVDALPAVKGDPMQLMQLFQNLIANAVKFHGDAPPRVHLTAERGEEEWVVSVSDNGIGIAPEFAERIFVIFQRLHSRDEYPGTGIGLSICKKIVERHGGRIWVEAAPGGGSSFHFTFPDRGPA